jgi:membrane carboxypeptidase/penicillin-binding protein PbpC
MTEIEMKGDRGRCTTRRIVQKVQESERKLDKHLIPKIRDQRIQHTFNAYHLSCIFYRDTIKSVDDIRSIRIITRLQRNTQQRTEKRKRLYKTETAENITVNLVHSLLSFLQRLEIVCF